MFSFPLPKVYSFVAAATTDPTKLAVLFPLISCWLFTCTLFLMSLFGFYFADRIPNAPCSLFAECSSFVIRLCPSSCTFLMWATHCAILLQLRNFQTIPAGEYKEPLGSPIRFILVFRQPHKNCSHDLKKLLFQRECGFH